MDSREATRTGQFPAMQALDSDPLWYMDAIIYQLHVKAFFDSNGDGIGDFRGLTEKLDYIRDLGVNTVWFMMSSVITRKPRVCASFTKLATSSRVP